MEPIRIGLLGMGTVGSGTFHALQSNQLEITRRIGRPIKIVAVADRDEKRASSYVKDLCRVTGDALSLIQDPEIDIIVEMIGGTAVARDLVLAAIAKGKHIVTSNKALLALYGQTILSTAEKQGSIVAFEASVGGGIPIIKTLRESLAGNQIHSVLGIVNGTTNFILSAMQEQQLDFASALKQAQIAGYAEADPNLDIEGIDSAHKLAILASLAGGIPISFKHIHIEGIANLQSKDMQYADQLGFRIKLLAIAKLTGKEGIELSVRPTLVPKNSLLANVNQAMNAIVVNSDPVGTTLYYGKGAGAKATASAVIADIIDVARQMHIAQEYRVPVFGFQSNALQNPSVLPIDELRGSYYLRLQAINQTGTFANITRILANANISIDALLQPATEQTNTQNNGLEADIILTTHPTKEKNMNATLLQIQQLAQITKPPIKLRIEHLNDF